MNIQWGSLLTVFAVALGSTITLVTLVTLALLGLTARTTPPGPTTLTPRAGTTLAAACLMIATTIVLTGLWTMIAK